jgi:hypothetical protein
VATEDRTVQSTGSHSIKVDTNGYFAGARIRFPEPIDITAQKNDPHGFLEFIIKFRQGTLRERLQQAAQRRGQGGPGGPGGFAGSGMMSGGGGPGAARPQGGFAGSGMMGGFGGANQAITPDTTKLRVVLGCAEGTFIANEFPVSLQPARTQDWFAVAIPFIAFKGLDAAQSANVREIRGRSG